jgi:hypothetical protein
MLSMLIPVDIVGMGFGDGGCHPVCLSLSWSATMLADFPLEVGQHL